MANEHETPTTLPEEQSPAAAVQEQPAQKPQPAGTPPPPHGEPGKRAVKGKSRPVIVYVTVMFAAAVLLLLFSFLMQQRNHEAIMNGLTSSQINAQTVVNLELENNKLDERIQELESALAAKQTDTDTLQADLASAQKSRQAMDWLLAIQDKYENRDHVTALKLVAEFTATGLPAFLPQTSALTETAADAHPEGEYLSPAARFAEIQEALS